MGSMDVRLVGADAWQTWRDIRLRALQDAPSAFGSTYESEAGFTEQHFRERLSGGGPAVLALADGEPVGMGGGFSDLEGWLKVVAMWVEPTWRGRQVGARVLDLLVGWAREHDLRVHLDVATDNPLARRFYQRFGFAGTGQTQPLRPGSAYLKERMVLPGRWPG